MHGSGSTRPRGRGVATRLSTLQNAPNLVTTPFQPEDHVVVRAPPRGTRGGKLVKPITAQQTLDELGNVHRTSEKGRLIQQDLDDLADDYFSREAPPMTNRKLPPMASSGGAGGGTYSKGVLSYQAQIPLQWNKGPQSPEGRLFDASDRNLLCMDVQDNLCVVGSADHGLKVFDINQCKEKRNLYNKKFGHTEWVTSCKFLPDGRILSGGMDSKLCLWSAQAARCDDLLAHTGSISQVDVNDSCIALSAAYDRTIRVWSLSRGGGACVSTLTGHGQPVTQFSWCGSVVLSGDRKGTVKLFDIEAGSCLQTCDIKHGQIGALGHLLSEDMGHLSMVGDQAGQLTVFDFHRSGKKPVFAQTLHPGGVLSGIKCINQSNLIVTVGADKVIKVLDARMDFQPVHTLTDHRDFIYALETFGSLILSGGGNGWLLAHDATTGKCLYGLGANQAAVREIFASPTHLVAAGDDGKATVYNF